MKVLKYVFCERDSLHLKNVGNITIKLHQAFWAFKYKYSLHCLPLYEYRTLLLMLCFKEYNITSYYVFSK